MWKKFKYFVSQIGICGLIFGLIIFSFATVNARKVIRFWVDGETDYNEWTVSMGSKGETDYISNFWGKIQFVNFNGLMRNITNQHEMNGIIKLNNGYLMTTHSYETNEALQDKADHLYNLDLYLKQKGIPMLFSICPYTSCKYNPQIPVGVEDYGNDNADRFMSMVSEYGIDSMDFRDEIYADGLDQYELMYKTDHHWTTEAGFYAYTKILPWIKKSTGVEIDEKVADISNYTMTSYRKWHLGSRGQRTGIYYAGIDDFVLITPDFETSMQRGDAEGSFNELLIDYAPLENKEYTSRYTYDNVMGKSLGNYINNNAINDVKVLIVTDSFGKAVSPYLIMSFREVRYIYDCSSSNLTAAYIDEYNPDVVILMYYLDCIGGDNRGFSFSINLD